MRRPSIHVAKRVKNCPHCGFNHDSIMEYRFCTRIHLEMRAQGSEISHIDVFPVVTLAKGVKWKLDFAVWKHVGCGLPEFIDVKSRFYAKKPDFKIKRKLFDAVHPAPLKVLCLAGKRWFEL